MHTSSSSVGLDEDWIERFNHCSQSSSSYRVRYIKVLGLTSGGLIYQVPWKYGDDNLVMGPGNPPINFMTTAR